MKVCKLTSGVNHHLFQLIRVFTHSLMLRMALFCSQQRGNDVDEEQQQPEPGGDKPASTRDSMDSVCSSQTLDDFLSRDRELKVSYRVPKSSAAEFVSAVDTQLPYFSDTDKLDCGVKAGLGIKRKKDPKKESASYLPKKAKTLSEKREALQADILKYGVAAVEKMYPRQSPNKRNPNGQGGGNAPGGGAPGGGKPQRKTPIKMKPKPSGFGEVEEIDARKILRPTSHSKYIHQPAYDSVVFITRRNGLVPLSSLCKDSKTVLSSNVRLLQGNILFTTASLRITVDSALKDHLGPAKIVIYNRLVSLAEIIYCIITFWDQKYWSL